MGTCCPGIARAHCCHTRTSLTALWPTAFFPDAEQMFEQFSQSWQSWCQANDLPGPLEALKQVFARSHAQYQREAQGRYRAEAIRSIRTKTEAAVWHCEDHRARQAVCNCPCLYHQSLAGTFQNRDIRSLGNLLNNNLARLRGKARRHEAEDILGRFRTPQHTFFQKRRNNLHRDVRQSLLFMPF